MQQEQKGYKFQEQSDGRILADQRAQVDRDITVAEAQPPERAVVGGTVRIIRNERLRGLYERRQQLEDQINADTRTGKAARTIRELDNIGKQILRTQDELDIANTAAKDRDLQQKLAQQATADAETMEVEGARAKGATVEEINAIKLKYRTESNEKPGTILVETEQGPRYLISVDDNWYVTDSGGRPISQAHAQLADAEQAAHTTELRTPKVSPTRRLQKPRELGRAERLAQAEAQAVNEARANGATPEEINTIRRDYRSRAQTELRNIRAQKDAKMAQAVLAKSDADKFKAKAVDAIKKADDLTNKAKMKPTAKNKAAAVKARREAETARQQAIKARQTFQDADAEMQSFQRRPLTELASRLEDTNETSVEPFEAVEDPDYAGLGEAPPAMIEELRSDRNVAGIRVDPLDPGDKRILGPEQINRKADRIFKSQTIKAPIESAGLYRTAGRQTYVRETNDIHSRLHEKMHEHADEAGIGDLKEEIRNVNEPVRPC